jgi:SulP family sulfate permease
MILFPLGQPIFEKLGSAGISMFYISCIISQLVYSCGGSIFKGGIGSEMVRTPKGMLTFHAYRMAD